MTIASTDISSLFRDTNDPSIIVADGFGLRLLVDRGHLVIEDGLGRHRRERRLPRPQRTVRRILILGHTGHLTLDAIRWCHDTGITVSVIDLEGHVLLVAGRNGRNDARLRHAQAVAANNDTGVVIAKTLLGAKINGQREVAATHLTARTAEILEQLSDELHAVDSLVNAISIEATASRIYFTAWGECVHANFASRDLDWIPEHWQRYLNRRSSIGGNSPRSAVDPVNAMLNYSYALAEAEARLACLGVGLDPGIGITHTTLKNRDSLALDLMEPLRSLAEVHLLRLMDRRRFSRDDFIETRAGQCRLAAGVTRDLANAIPLYARAAAGYAEQVVHALASSSPGKIALTTPLSRSNTVNTQLRGQRSSRRREESVGMKARRNCQQCGADLYGRARKLCPSCWPIQRKEYMRQLGLARAKPSTEQRTDDSSAGITSRQYHNEILPGLAEISLADIERVTGLVNGSCSRVRRGLQTPHPRHWGALRDLTEANVRSAILREATDSI